MVTDSDRNTLNRNGFFFTDRLFSSEKIKAAREGLWEVIHCNYETGVDPESRFWNPGDNPKSIIKIDKPHLCNTALFDLITDKSFGKELARVTGARRIQAWHSQAVWKPSGGGDEGNAGWHRDIQYWPFWKHEGVLTAWIALTDVAQDSGPVRYIAGSNQWDPVEGLDFFDKGISNQETILKDTYKDYSVVQAEIDEGAVSIHTSKVYHSSVANVSGRPRVGMVVHFCTDRSQRVPVSGENSDYLDMVTDESICPVIFRS